MSALLEQFLSEAREFLQGISEKLMQLEYAPEDAGLMNELFRLVHTLKGNSGLFDFGDMTRVLHAGEDLMDGIRSGKIAYSQALADSLLAAMDFVSMLCDEVESGKPATAAHTEQSIQLAAALRALIPSARSDAAVQGAEPPLSSRDSRADAPALTRIPEAVRLNAWTRSRHGTALHWVAYRPAQDCFFQGDDPFHRARQTPDCLWGHISPRAAFPPLAELDAYCCMLDLDLLTAASADVLADHYRYVSEQVDISALSPLELLVPTGTPPDDKAGLDDFVTAALSQLEQGALTALGEMARTQLALGDPACWTSSALRWLLVLLADEPDQHAGQRALILSLRSLRAPDWQAVMAEQAARPASAAWKLAAASAPTDKSRADVDTLEAIFSAQRQILMLEDRPTWLPGRIQAVAAVLSNCCKATGNDHATGEIDAALSLSLASGDSAPLLAWLRACDISFPVSAVFDTTPEPSTQAVMAEHAMLATAPASRPVDEELPGDRRGDDSQAVPKSLKVDQAKIDLLMNLIGEMVVSKNALPYLAQRAEANGGVPDLARDIKVQYTVINRIVEEMQSAIMQVRMMPVSFVFQRFPRFVRDLSRKLDKEVQLVLQGEETEADKNIIESLADPLIHIVRNSLDHGLETPEARRAAGKPPFGTLTIRASQEGDRVQIEIADDGRGIDPAVIKRKAYEKGLIDEASLEHIADREAINLVFAPGFSTAEVVSDLSGRGVGMDVVRSAVEKFNGSILLDSEVGKGTRICISLPLSMAITNVMIVESDKQVFGIPMDHVVETVRVPLAAIQTIKRSKTTVLRDGVVHLKSLNALLGLVADPQPNADLEMAVLVVRIGGEAVGLIVDDFHETVDVIQKPLSGVLAGLPVYSGSALMGDGSVLMILNTKEFV